MPFSESFTLNDGHSIPWVAIGTGTAVWGRDAEATIKQAIENGVTHLDTAQSYKNEETVGAGISQGGVPRENLFVTTKLDELPKGKKVIDTLRDSLRKLGLEYVNLFLIHSPLQHQDLVSVWKGMEECQKAGLVRSIGVSNFRKDQLETIIEGGSIVPAVNQIEYHPYLARASAPLLEYAAQKKIIITSYAGLTPITRHTSGPLSPILGTIRERLASERGAPVTDAQVLLKWINQIGVVSITTTSKAERVKEYLDVATLPDLTEEEVHQISEIDYHHRGFGHMWSERP